MQVIVHHSLVNVGLRPHGAKGTGVAGSPQILKYCNLPAPGRAEALCRTMAFG